MIPKEKLDRVASHLLAIQAELSVPALRLHPLRLLAEMGMDLVNVEPDLLLLKDAELEETRQLELWPDE